MTSREAEIVVAEKELQAREERLAQEDIELDLEHECLENMEEAVAAKEDHYQKSVTSFNTRFAEQKEEQRQKVAAELKAGRESYRKELREEFSKKCKE